MDMISRPSENAEKRNPLRPALATSTAQAYPYFRQEPCRALRAVPNLELCGLSLRAVKFYAGLTFGILRKAARHARDGRFGPGEYAQFSAATAQLIEDCGGTLEIEGLDRVPDGTAVFAGNHSGSGETMMLGGLLQPHRDVAFVIKQELLTHRNFGPIFERLPNVPVTRAETLEGKKHDARSLREIGGGYLASGTSIIVFPEGERTRTFRPKEFNQAGALMADNAGVPLVPVAIDTRFWGFREMDDALLGFDETALKGLGLGFLDKVRRKVNRSLRDAGAIRADIPVRIAFGDPIPASAGRKVMHARCLEFITDKLKDWEFPIEAAR